MPQCPICHAAVLVGQQYCTTCTNPLPHPEEKDCCCPQCGNRLATPQETCQRCKVTLPGIGGITSAAPARSWRLPLGVPGRFLGAGLIIVALALVLFFHKKPVPPQLVMTPPSEVASEQTPAISPISASAPAPLATTVAAVQEIAVSAAPAAASPPAVTPPTSPLPRYFVNNDGLSVRDGPDTSAPRIATLKFQDEVELLETSGGWGRVRDVQRHIVGWSSLRYLQPVAAAGSRVVSQHRPADPKEPETFSAKDPNDM